jgi:ribosomal protein S27E
LNYKTKGSLGSLKNYLRSNPIFIFKRISIGRSDYYSRMEKERIMTEQQQHCPGFEANKSLTELKVKCAKCGKIDEIFSDELGKEVKCSACGAAIDTQKCQVK